MGIVKRTLNGIYNLFLGMKVTIKYLFKPAITLQYPKERWTMPERSRGMVGLVTNPETGKLNCTACLICMRNCPIRAIYITQAKDEAGKRVPDEFVVEAGLCIYCGICEEVCPFSAIKLIPKYEYSTYDKKELIHRKEKLAEIGKGFKYMKWVEIGK
jgi:NADH-quinone oxidoreductase subunit I